jgi:hypothetical protein
VGFTYHSSAREGVKFLKTDVCIFEWYMLKGKCRVFDGIVYIAKVHLILFLTIFVKETHTQSHPQSI